MRNPLEQLKEEDLNDRQQKLLKTSKFLGKMILAGLIFHLILFIYPNTVPLQAFLADIVADFFRLSGVPAYTRSIDIILESGTYRITQDCLGWKSMAAFTALVYASSEQLKDNLQFLGLGIIGITGANFFRIITTVYLSHTKIISFDIIHGLFWKWGLTLFILVLWGLWFNQKSTNL